MTMIVQNNLPIERTNKDRVGVPVFLQDQTTRILNLPFSQKIGDLTLAADTVVGSRTITLEPGHGLTAGNVGEIVELSSPVGPSYFMISTILAVSGDTLTLDSPVDKVYTTDTLVIHSAKNINVDGSVTPQVFTLAPSVYQSGDIVKIAFNIIDGNPMDFETFGSLPSLANGLVVRTKNRDGTYTNLYNFKNNEDFILAGFDHSFNTNVGNNARGFASKVTWGGQGNSGVVIRLEGKYQEELQVLVQDNLTDLDLFYVVGQGSNIQD